MIYENGYKASLGYIGVSGPTGMCGIIGTPTDFNETIPHLIPLFKEQMKNKKYRGTDNNWQKRGSYEK